MEPRKQARTPKPGRPPLHKREPEEAEGRKRGKKKGKEIFRFDISSFVWEADPELNKDP